MEACIVGIDNKMVLTTTPTSLAVKLRTCRGVNSVSLWTFPYEGYRFIRLLNQNPGECVELRRYMEMEQRPFKKRGNVYPGRLLQFRGRFRGTLVLGRCMAFQIRNLVRCFRINGR